jgi:hypothetical protein
VHFRVSFSRRDAHQKNISEDRFVYIAVRAEITKDSNQVENFKYENLIQSYGMQYNGNLYAAFPSQP